MYILTLFGNLKETCEITTDNRDTEDITELQVKKSLTSTTHNRKGGWERTEREIECCQDNCYRRVCCHARTGRSDCSRVFLQTHLRGPPLLQSVSDKTFSTSLSQQQSNRWENGPVFKFSNYTYLKWESRLEKKINASQYSVMMMFEYKMVPKHF